MLRDSQINTRIDQETLKWLRAQKNQSEVIREGIELYRQAHDPIFKDLRKKKLLKEIEEKQKEVKEMDEPKIGPYQQTENHYLDLIKKFKTEYPELLDPRLESARCKKIELYLPELRKIHPYRDDIWIEKFEKDVLK